MSFLLKYVIGHWSGSNYEPNSIDLNSYQLLITGSGKVVKGMPIGKASSTGGMNSITYNISCCGGLPSTPIKPVQIERFYKECAMVLKQFNLSVDKFYTHAEIGEMCKNGTIVKLLPYNRWLYQNKGKIDLTKIPNCVGSAKQTGDYIRNKIKWYMSK